MSKAESTRPLGLFIQPACLQHRYIRHANSSHIFERPERLRAVLLGVAAAVARLELAQADFKKACDQNDASQASIGTQGRGAITANDLSIAPPDDLSSMLSSLSITSSAFTPPAHLNIVPPLTPMLAPGQVLLHHPALQLAHSPPPGAPFPDSFSATSPYLKDLFKWASEAVERIKETGNEIPQGLNQSDLYLGPGSILAIEGAIQTLCQAIDGVCETVYAVKAGTSTPPLPHLPSISQTIPAQPSAYLDATPESSSSTSFTKAFCAIRPPGHHCGQDIPSGFCYVNNVVVGAMHGNGTQALVMPLNAASHAEDLAVQSGKPVSTNMGRKGKRRQGWKGFYGSVHDIYSYPCEDGDLGLVKDASISLAGHGQYIENIHLQPYASEADFYERIYPKYLALLDKAKFFLAETDADPERTIVLISAGFDACEHEHQGMQRHDRRVPTSFFARYTRDIVAFANTHTDGKVISVLEGGYSDRALTSASMGHVLGLLDQPGQPDWWSEAELHNIEKATKKKRTGRIAPFPSEMSSFPYLARTHILLTHFEGVPSEASNLSTSATTTPQPSSRMTLRNRGRAANGEEGSPMAARRQTRGTPRMKANTPSSGAPIETKDVMSASPMKPIIVTSPELSTPETKSPLDGAQRTNAADNSALHDVTIGVESVRLDTPVKERDDSRAFAAEALLSLVAPLEAGSDPTSNSPPESSLKPPVCLPMSGQDQSSREHQASATQPKIILRIPRPSPPPPGDTPGHAPVAQQEQKPIYPFLLHAPNKIPEERRLSYRESSAVTTSSDPTSDTEGEYASAQSGLSGGERAAKETSVETNVSEEQ